MLTYIARRILYSIPVLFVSTFLSFMFVSLAGDPRQNLLANPKLSHAHYKALFHTYHLDVSIPVRYWYWLQDVFEHKLGSSLLTSQPIWPDITRAMGHTLQVIGIAEIIAITLGVAVGIFSAVKQYSIFDYLFTTVSFLGYAMPTFWLALLLQILFTDIYLSYNVRIFYTSGLNSGVTSNTWSLDRLQHIALPVATLAIISFAVYSRYMRASMLDVISTDYIRTARAKGLPERLVIMRHVFRNALIPVVTVAALNIGGLLGGAIITETIFSLDGMVYYFIQKLGQLDVYAVMAYLAITSLFIIIFNLIADVVYGYLDPRIRYD
ncbi:MAG: ABC transporter permease [Actinobacteria bacterium]|nr:ABC transporter permease [Actinomycetota bacterium]